MLFARRLLTGATLLLLGAGAAFAQNNPDFRLTNGLGQAINEVYVSSSATNAWGPDLLGSGVLAPGAVLNVTVPAGQCVNDIRLVLASGQSMERRNLNTCELTDVTVTP